MGARDGKQRAAYAAPGVIAVTRIRPEPPVVKTGHIRARPRRHWRLRRRRWRWRRHWWLRRRWRWGRRRWRWRRWRWRWRRRGWLRRRWRRGRRRWRWRRRWRRGRRQRRLRRRWRRGWRRGWRRRRRRRRRRHADALRGRGARAGAAATKEVEGRLVQDATPRPVCACGRCVITRGLVPQAKRRGGGIALALGGDEGATAGAALDHVVRWRWRWRRH